MEKRSKQIRFSLTAIVVTIALVLGLFSWKYAFVSRNEIVAVQNVCTYDLRNCRCPAPADAHAGEATCYINEADGSLQIVSHAPHDGPTYLGLFDASGKQVSGTPSLATTLTSYRISSITKESGGTYLVDFGNPGPENYRKDNLLGGNLHRFIRVSFSPELKMVDLTSGRDLLVLRYDQFIPNSYEAVNFRYGFDIGEDPGKPEFILMKLDLRSGVYSEVADLTKSIRSSRLLKALNDPYGHYVQLSYGQDGHPFAISVDCIGMCGEPSETYLVNTSSGTVSRIK